MAPPYPHAPRQLHHTRVTDRLPRRRANGPKAAQWWALIALGPLAAVGGTVRGHQYRQQQAWRRVRQQALRYQLPKLDALHHRDFAHVIRDGCIDGQQFKHRKDGDRGSAVGTPDLQLYCAEVFLVIRTVKERPQTTKKRPPIHAFRG